ncbi:MAG: TPM domain-containing protein [Spirochaetales bacterium]|uniref:TPM domain-containing protein n=1 Tax=Candidatus Thalassospirochaeta sargassi TaxID=3119039 RepID=A0AAJ1IDJ5_9SPIO|nr:TPM domain-containing protein [Spirochaetales bacterium]
MKKRILKSLVLSLALFAVGSTQAFALNIPKLDSPVVDKAGVISNNDEAVIEQMLYELEQTTGAQLAVLTVPDLGDESLESYSIAVADEWELGQAGEDNGVLILLALRERKVRIEVGYGLEGDLTDVKSGYIIRELMLPQFRDGNYAQGIYDGASAVSGVILQTADISAEEIAAAEQAAQQNNRSSRAGIPFNLVVFFIIIVFSSISRLGRHGRYARRRGGILPWLFLGSMMGSGRRYGRDDDFRGGGFGGGGFGGFSGGGGSFGGGGASGGW